MVPQSLRFRGLGGADSTGAVLRMRYFSVQKRGDWQCYHSPRHTSHTLSRRQKQMASIQNKVIVITGASEGIGAALAIKLAQGNKLVLAARRLEKLQEVGKQV
ncbi:MAG: SDR family NAD(P)-dependent oxidoreductase, partial [Limnobacter sp.]